MCCIPSDAWLRNFGARRTISAANSKDSVREAGYGDLHKNIQELRSLHPANQLKDQIVRAMQEPAQPKPVEPPAVKSAAAEAPPAKEAALPEARRNQRRRA